MRNVKVAQNLIRDALEDPDQVDTLSFVSSASMSMGEESIGERILAKHWNFDIEAFRQQRTYRKAFAYLRERIESNRIFVLLLSDLGSHHTTIPINVFRGFVYSDDLAPFVVINRNDAVSAWSFTALHEIAHLCLGSSGVSRAMGAICSIERFCNQVAGKILFPSHERDVMDLDYGTDKLADQIGHTVAGEKAEQSYDCLFPIYGRHDRMNRFGKS